MTEIHKKLKFEITIPLNHQDRQMKFLITFMGYVDAIMAKGRSKYGFQNGLKGRNTTLWSIKTIDPFNYIHYIFGVHGALLDRYLGTYNRPIGSIIIQSQNFFTEYPNNDKITKIKQTPDRYIKVYKSI
jgi:hypothetical protein